MAARRCSGSAHDCSIRVPASAVPALGSVAPSVGSGARGRVTPTVRPPPGVPASESWPLLALTRASTMASPSPVPEGNVR